MLFKFRNLQTKYAKYWNSTDTKDMKNNEILQAQKSCKKCSNFSTKNPHNITKYLSLFKFLTKEKSHKSSTKLTLHFPVIQSHFSLFKKETHRKLPV
jgi:hypothetical protein